MNFVLDILGRAHRAGVGGMRGGSGALGRVRAAVVAGEFAKAAELLEEAAGDAVWGLFARGQLNLMSGGYAEAAWCFSEGMERVMGAVDGSLEVGAGSALEKMIGAAEGALRQGRCGRAAGLFGRARGVVDELLAAEAGLCVAEGRLAGHMRAGRVERLVPLARLGDVLLKAEARGRLAGSVAEGMEKRDRAGAWMVGAGRVTELLEGEFEALAAAGRGLRGHAELHVRLGLVARALGRTEAAGWALGEVMRVHPHHVSTAARLGATLVERGEGSCVMAVLAVALGVSRQTVEGYDALAAAAGGDGFDEGVEVFAKESGGVVGRANLAFALGELGLLEGTRAEWREVVRVGA
jgi:hypothetical protein